MNDRASPGCGRQGNARRCDTHIDITPTSIILIISIHNPSWVQESVVETKKRPLFKTNVFGRCLTNNLGLIHGVGVVEACRGPVPVIILEYLAGRTKSARGPDKIGSRAGPGPRAVSCTWFTMRWVHLGYTGDLGILSDLCCYWITLYHRNDIRLTTSLANVNYL